MLAKIIFFIAVAAAALVVILLAFHSPSPHNKNKSRSLSFAFYLQPHHPLDHHRRQASIHANNAFVFRYKLTSGPKSATRMIGKAQGFALPIDRSALAAFDMVYFTFDAPEYYGSLCVEARRAEYGTKEELVVVGGTGYFSFAQGIATFVPKNRIELRLRLPR